MSIGTLFLCVGLFFFVDGLDDDNDYLRLSHGIWHLSASVFGYYCIEAVKIKKISKESNKAYF
jgi:predicted membrane channel-forming protein YqfA (hemolysin III family)